MIDRGAIKWTAMMLPEHLQRIREWKQESNKEQKYELSIWEIEELQETINRAFSQNRTIILTIWRNDKYIKLTGIIQCLRTNELIFKMATKTVTILYHNLYTAYLEDEIYD